MAFRIILSLFVLLIGTAGCKSAIHHSGKAPATTQTQDKVLPAASQFSDAPSDKAKINPALPTLFVAGDSTAADSHTNGGLGWAVPFYSYFNTSKLNVINLARGGRSSRTYVTEGLWDKLLAQVKPGDYVIIQFGHNDATEVDSAQARGTIPGIGEETQDVNNKLTGKPETVHTFGWYMRKMINDTKTKGATPILISLTLHNSWKNGQIERGPGEFAKWCSDLSAETNIAYVDLSALEGDTFQEMGPQKTTKLYRGKTHFGPEMADLHARFVVVGLEQLPKEFVEPYLNDAGRTTVKEYQSTRRLMVKE